MTPRFSGPLQPDRSALDHPRHQALFDAIAAEPGATRSQLGARVGSSRGVLEFYLSVLEDAGLIQRLPGAEERELLCFTYEDVHLWRDKVTRLLYGNPATRNVALLIAAWPGVARQELEMELGQNSLTVLFHLRRLECQGLVMRGPPGQRMNYFPLRPLRDWVRVVGHLYERPWGALPADADPFDPFEAIDP